MQQLNLWQPKVRRKVSLASSSVGFTIVELLIVIVVIGILAAIVIVAYNGVQNRAKDTTVQSDLSTMAKKLEIAKVDNNTYPFPPTTTTDIHITKSAYLTNQNNLYYCYNSATDKYVISARSASGQQFKLVDGVVSTHGSQLFGQTTCDLLSAGVTWATGGSLGYDNSTTTWASWAQ